jgi:hypothetical protein
MKIKNNTTKRIRVEYKLHEKKEPEEVLIIEPKKVMNMISLRCTNQLDTLYEELVITELT